MYMVNLTDKEPAHLQLAAEMYFLAAEHFKSFEQYRAEELMRTFYDALKVAAETSLEIAVIDCSVMREMSTKELSSAFSYICALLECARSRNVPEPLLELYALPAKRINAHFKKYGKPELEREVVNA